MFKKLANKILNQAEDVLAREAMKAITPHIETAATGLVNAVINSAPQARSTGGGTSVYLAKIKSDFKDFHAEDADTAISSFIYELLQITYGEKESFEKANVSQKILINTSNKKTGRLSNVKINAMSIGDYQKSLNSATIKYRVSTGFDVSDSRYERLYEVEYTLQLRDEYGEQKFLECQHCGAPLEEESGECKYCGMKHLRDTTSNWVITDYSER